MWGVGLGGCAVMAMTVATMSLFIERLWVVLPGSPYFDSLRLRWRSRAASSCSAA